ncbi:MAG: hypothetical protein JKY13_03720 [Gammaproteobacteria bacterium]|nr:hypothetical protein [Gammaproteobacteria bacterium]
MARRNAKRGKAKNKESDSKKLWGFEEPEDKEIILLQLSYILDGLEKFKTGEIQAGTTNFTKLKNLEEVLGRIPPSKVVKEVNKHIVEAKNNYRHMYGDWDVANKKKFLEKIKDKYNGIKKDLLASDKHFISAENFIKDTADIILKETAATQTYFVFPCNTLGALQRLIVGNSPDYRVQNPEKNLKRVLAKIISEEFLPKIQFELLEKLRAEQEEIALLQQKKSEELKESGKVGPTMVAFLPAGQGDCNMIRSSQGKIFLVDCGAKGGLIAHMRKLAEGGEKIDIIRAYLTRKKFWGKDFSKETKQVLLGGIFTTHGDIDHVNKFESKFESKSVNAWDEFKVSAPYWMRSGDLMKNSYQNKMVPFIKGATHSLDENAKLSGIRLSVNEEKNMNKISIAIANDSYNGELSHGNVLKDNGGTISNINSNMFATKGFVAEKITEGDKMRAALVCSEKDKDNNDEIVFELFVIASDVTYTENSKYKDKYDKPIPSDFEGKDREYASNQANSGSLCLVVRSANQMCLMVGDATLNTEHFLIENFSKTLAKLNVVQIGHHGSSRTSFSKRFIKALSNVKAFIICAPYANSPHGHPRKLVIDLARKKLENLKVVKHDLGCYEGTGDKRKWKRLIDVTEPIWTTGSNGIIEVIMGEMKLTGDGAELKEKLTILGQNIEKKQEET